MGPGPGSTTCRFFKQTRLSIVMSCPMLVVGLLNGSSGDEITVRQQVWVAAESGTAKSQKTTAGRFGFSSAIVCAGPTGCQVVMVVRLKSGGVRAFGRFGSPALASATKARMRTLCAV